MNRLTNKLENNSYDFACSYNTFMYNGGQEEIINKLGKLEDIEEQLGCPLEVLFKALENGIYTIDKTWYSLVNLYFSDRNLYCQAKFKNSIVVHIKDYKKTWWLKEDKTE